VKSLPKLTIPSVVSFVLYSHGTRCASEVAAEANNSVCCVIFCTAMVQDVLVKSLPKLTIPSVVSVSLITPRLAVSLAARSVARNLLNGEQTRGFWGTEVPSGVQGQNMETLENINGAVTKIDLW